MATHYPRAAVGLAIVLVAGGLVWEGARVLRRSPRGVEALWESVADRRPVEARLSGQTTYRAFPPPTAHVVRGRAPTASRPDATESPILLRAAADIYQEAADRPSDASFRAIADLLIVRGAIDMAIARLERLTTGASADAKALNDLAAAYVERARVEDRAYDLVKALDAVDRALVADPTLPEARFTKAVTLERMSLANAARAEWTSYLEFDAASGWADEARERAAAIDLAAESTAWDTERETVEAAIESGDYRGARVALRRFPHLARMYAWEELLPQWADAATENRPADADRAIRAARFLGATLAEDFGDAWVRDSVAAADAADADRRRAVAEGHRLLRDAREIYQTTEKDRAEDVFDRARAAFERGGDSAGTAAGLLGCALCDHWKLSYRAAERRLDAVKAIADDRGYVYLSERARWLRGLIAAGESRLSAAIEAYGQALPYARAAAHDEGVAMLHGLIGEALGTLQEEAGSCASYMRSLGALSRAPRTNARQQILSNFALALLKIGEPRAALTVQEEAIAAAENGDPSHLAFAYVARAKIHQRLGHEDPASADLTRADDLTASVRSPSVRARLDVNILLARAEGALTSDPADARRYCDEATALFGASPDTSNTIDAQVIRARASLLLRDDEEAGRALSAAIAAIERRRAQISDSSLRASAMRDSYLAFDEMISYQLRARSDEATAFAYAEASRGRSLLDLLDQRERSRAAPERAAGDVGANVEARPLTLEEIEESLPDKAALVEYTVLPDSLVIWVVRPGSLECAVSPVDETSLSREIVAFREALSSDDADECGRGSTRLYELLVLPIEGLLSNVDTVVVIPDKVLQKVPFAALARPRSGEYLIEYHALVVAPSASVYVSCLRRERALSRRPAARVLVVGNPAFDRDLFARFPSLPEAESEARAIGELYPKARVLIGEEATAPKVLAAMGEADVVHYAGHSASSVEGPGESALLLAPAANANDVAANGAVGPAQLASLDLSRARLVVLAACRTGDGAGANREGAYGLARAVLVAGCPAVVASCLDADDRASAELFVEFHRLRLEGQDASHALRGAQLALLRGADPSLRSPSAWAAYELLGGASTTSP